MDETKKHIDELVATRNQKQAELLTWRFFHLNNG